VIALVRDTDVEQRTSKRVKNKKRMSLKSIYKKYSKIPTLFLRKVANRFSPYIKGRWRFHKTVS
jgi:hypothetical protein